MTMYFVLNTETDETVATTYIEEYARWISENFPVPTVVRAVN